MNNAVAISAGDRLTFTLVAALLVHALLIFGVRFVQPEAKAAQALEVTLVRQQSLEAPKQADFLAQANQQGSGQAEQAQLLTTTEIARIPSEDEQAEQAAMAALAPPPEQALVTSITGAPSAVRELSPAAPMPPAAQAPLAQQDVSAESIAALEARLAARRQAYAKRPRIHTLSTVSAKADGWAQYLDSFRVRVEAAGNADYPAQAKAQGLEGRVRLLVAILPTGRVQNVTLLKSSGSRVLDEAAMRSVQLAQPYDRFSAEQRSQVDVLQIVRTWQFSGGVATNRQ